MSLFLCVINDKPKNTETINVTYKIDTYNEPFLHAGLASPCIPVGLTFNKDHLWITSTIPSKPVCNGSGSFVESPVVEFYKKISGKESTRCEIILSVLREAFTVE